MRQEKNIEEFLKKNEFRFFKNKNLSEYTTFRLKSVAPYVVEILSYEELTIILNYFIKQEIKYVLLGGGSNVVFISERIDCVVIVNKTSGINLNDEYIEIDSGVRNSNFLNFCVKNSISGFEFLSGIPGTIGGAVAVNAGAFGKSISEMVMEAVIINKSANIKRINNNDFNFEYRNSRFKTSDEVILRIYFKYEKGNSDYISSKIKKYYEYRKNNHPSYDEFSAGCFFKNPLIDGQKISAGKLIDQVGLRGFEYKGFKISEKHANFLLNKNNSGFKELKEFEQLIKKKVKEKKGINFDREVIYIDKKGSKL